MMNLGKRWYMGVKWEICIFANMNELKCYIILCLFKQKQSLIRVFTIMIIKTVIINRLRSIEFIFLQYLFKTEYTWGTCQRILSTHSIERPLCSCFHESESSLVVRVYTLLGGYAVFDFTVIVVPRFGTTTKKLN